MEHKESPQDMQKFPVELIDSIRSKRIWQFENEEIQNDEDFSELLECMYEFVDDEFFLFTPESKPINSFVSSASELNVIAIVETRMSYYVHPRFKKNYVRIRAGLTRWEWQREVLASGNMLLRHQLKLSERTRREFEMRQLIDMQKTANSNPIKLEPNFMGVGIDLRKAYGWLMQRFKKVQKSRSDPK